MQLVILVTSNQNMTVSTVIQATTTQNTAQMRQLGCVHLVKK